MRVGKYYLENFIAEYEKKFGEKVEYDDDIGVYYFRKINLKVNSWNHKIFKIDAYFGDEEINNLLSFINRVTDYYVVEDSENE